MDQPEQGSSPATPSPAWQLALRTVLAVAVFALGCWVLFDFLPALAWAGVLAIALWPLYDYLLRALPANGGHLLAPSLATLLIGAVIIAPLVLLGIALAHETHFAFEFIAEARHHGMPPPTWIQQLPLVGPTVSDWWNRNLIDPVLADELFGKIDVGTLTASARHYGGEVVHRLAILGFTLLTLFFLFRDGKYLSAQLLDLSDRAIGQRGERIARQMVAAVHGTVTGLVLVGLAEGVLLGISYFAVDLPYPALVGAATGLAAIIPFAAPAVYCLAGLYLFTVGNTFGAFFVIGFGSAIVFIADHFVRPGLIGGAARLPFLLVLLGILGGLESMGFIGLFLGPAVMAAIVALWREWTEPERSPETVRAPAGFAAAAPPPPRRPVGGGGRASGRTRGRKV